MQERKPLIAGNWKMFKTQGEAVETAKQLVALAGDVTECDMMIAPPFTALSGVHAIIGASAIGLGAQNFFWEPEGPYTGEISAAMLVSAGCRYAIIGHSERRQLFGETDSTVNKKLAAAFENGLIPVFCIGESEKERDAGQTFSVLDKQLKMGLKGLSLKTPSSLVIAYEPIWAIGTGKTATKDQAQQVHHFLRSLLADNWGISLANSTRILYGGSVKSTNIKELMGMPDIDGALVGGASLDAAEFNAIIHFFD